VSERLSEGIFSLPMHPYLSEAEQERIVEAIPLESV
jgi:dTDP-4-amino-4,6-dideoxygalactose transaminase